MKYCRNCGEQLPDEANFCPKCMMQLNRPTQIESIRISKRRFPFWIMTSGCFFIVGIIGILMIHSIVFKNSPNEEPSTISDKSPDKEDNFDSLFISKIGEQYPENPHDLSNYLGRSKEDFLVDYPTTEEIYSHEEIGGESWFYDELELYFAEDGYLSELIIDYSYAVSKDRYEVMGINGTFTYSDIISKLGTPDVSESENLLVYSPDYDYDAISETWTTLYISLDDNGKIEQIRQTQNGYGY